MGGGLNEINARHLQTEVGVEVEDELGKNIHFKVSIRCLLLECVLNIKRFSACIRARRVSEVFVHYSIRHSLQLPEQTKSLFSSNFCQFQHKL